MATDQTHQARDSHSEEGLHSGSHFFIGRRWVVSRNWSNFYFLANAESSATTQRKRNTFTLPNSLFPYEVCRYFTFFKNIPTFLPCPGLCLGSLAPSSSALESPPPLFRSPVLLRRISVALFHRELESAATEDRRREKAKKRLPRR